MRDIHSLKKALFIGVIMVLMSTPVSAVSTPSFPTCVSPQGTLISSYATGVHGIVDSTATYTGSDDVYRLTSDTYTQCFCSEGGQGIQTNWWKVSSLTESQRSELVSSGWHLVPEGASWGLPQGEYYARNSSYACTQTSSQRGQVLGLASTGWYSENVNLLLLTSISFVITSIFWSLSYILARRDSTS